ncbi:MAG TPA: pseudaminic acid synthase [Polyangiaceae bacterium]|nr:pseudaminic acid synthase [Polyangiaceae bacterium]
MTARSFDLGSRRVGEGCPVLLVAELSANHGGRLDCALRTIEAAAKAGADAIKLQTYTPDTLTLRSDAPPFIVRTKNEWAGRTLHDLYAEAMTPWEWHGELKACALANGLLLFSTPFDPTAVEYLEQLGVPAHKIASFEIVDLPLVEHVARRGKPVIISTGMASLGEIEAAVAVCRSVGNEDIALLRCVSAYPAQPAAMNLQSLEVLRSLAAVVGLSDHTRDATVAVASVALGAKIVEKHFILDRSVGGPDAFFSLEPDEFAHMVRAVRATESAIGAPRFGPSDDEKASTAFRRSLFVARPVATGEVLTCDDVRSVRPAHGLDPRCLPEVLGKRAARDLEAATPLDWRAVGPAPDASIVSLEPATRDDGPLLLSLRNDPVARSMSTSTAPVKPEEHAAWLAATLERDDRVLLVARSGGSPIGYARLDLAGAAAEVSIAVSAQARGHGFGTAILRAVEPAARARGVSLLTARIRDENTASVRAFKRAGYYAFVPRDVGGAAFVLCERRITPFSVGR